MIRFLCLRTPFGPFAPNLRDQTGSSAEPN
jgi:hypothetical protein